ncbi:sigma 54-interacting transcriptional regulator [Spirosoma spitsbergense]|uniref:sigma 54-interacting transcriptional regulator n=1 Tax=Spirosoma spitsbergense TaxID=431554 RepID=UPI00039B37CC|nr:sigma 54-interacting transcriptional regulator [Spirosoma spitsbergense]
MHHPTHPALASPSSCQVLIVEDEYIIANDLELILHEAGYIVTGVADSVPEARTLIDQQRPDMVLLDIYLKGKETGIDLARHLESEAIPFIYISANDNQSVLEAVKATQPSGYVVKPFREKDVLTTLEIGRYRYAHSVEMKLREEKALQIALTDALSEAGSWEEKLLKAAMLLQEHIPFDFLAIQFCRQQTQRSYNFYRVGFEEYQVLGVDDIQPLSRVSASQLLAMQAKATHHDAQRYTESSFADFCRTNPFGQVLAQTFRLESALVMPLKININDSFVISFLSRKPDTYQFRHLSLLERLEQPIVLMLERVLAFDEVARLSEQLQREKTYLLEEVKTSANFDEIIGRSQSLLRVFDQVSQVAYTDTTVLVLGESGTGKELIARAIHNLSGRKDRILVKVNCAALPANLIESELFGHEKGAFTGALEKRTGKFELAQGGTIFLDEIGEMPLELQAKLLRVLQEKEIERVGGKTLIKIDVRVIAATNRQLEKEVSEGRFRMDLYFRLATFPITLPPLRERMEDIPPLAQFFAQKSARKIGRSLRGISQGMLAELLTYSWPGNIRELENVMEQAVIISDGQTPLELGRPLVGNLFALNLFATGPDTRTGQPGQQTTTTPPKDLHDVRQIQQQTEREYIMAVLQQTNGRIRGSGGAAELLNLKPTTLEYRLEKLGIRKTMTVQPTSFDSD